MKKVPKTAFLKIAGVFNPGRETSSGKGPNGYPYEWNLATDRIIWHRAIHNKLGCSQKNMPAKWNGCVQVHPFTCRQINNKHKN